jgi:hypothetical protein
VVFELGARHFQASNKLLYSVVDFRSSSAARPAVTTFLSAVPSEVDDYLPTAQMPHQNLIDRAKDVRQ